MDTTQPIPALFHGSNADENEVLKLLYIEDNPADCVLLRENLTDLDGSDAGLSLRFDITEARDLETGLEAIYQRIDSTGENFDLILLDLHLPGIDGKDAYNTILKEYPNVPVIVLSGEKNPRLARELIGLGVQDFLIKEFSNSPDLIARSIYYAIERKRIFNERELLQNQLIQAEKLDSLGRIAAGVAHEVKNPLSIIQFGLSYITSFQKEIEEPGFGEACTELLEASNRAIDIVTEMVEFSRDDSVTLSYGDPSDPVRKAARLINYEIVKSNTQFFESYSPEPVRVLLDIGKMEQIIMNLIRNSVQAMTEAETENRTIHISTFTSFPGELMAEPGLLDWAVERNVDQVTVIELRDSGPGVDDDKLNRIFEPFFTTKSKTEGTGLGLSVVLQIVELHGGLIRIKNMRNPTGLRTRIYLKSMPEKA